MKCSNKTKRVRYFFILKKDCAGNSLFVSVFILFAWFVFFARYTMSYDWSQGIEHANPQGTNNIYVHPVTDEEIKPRPKDKK